METTISVIVVALTAIAIELLSAAYRRVTPRDPAPGPGGAGFPPERGTGFCRRCRWASLVPFIAIALISGYSLIVQVTSRQPVAKSSFEKLNVTVGQLPGKTFAGAYNGSAVVMRIKPATGADPSVLQYTLRVNEKQYESMGVLFPTRMQIESLGPAEFKRDSHGQLEMLFRSGNEQSGMLTEVTGR